MCGAALLVAACGGGVEQAAAAPLALSAEPESVAFARPTVTFDSLDEMMASADLVAEVTPRAASAGRWVGGPEGEDGFGLREIEVQVGQVFRGDAALADTKLRIEEEGFNRRDGSGTFRMEGSRWIDERRLVLFLWKKRDGSGAYRRVDPHGDFRISGDVIELPVESAEKEPAAHGDEWYVKLGGSDVGAFMERLRLSSKAVASGQVTPKLPSSYEPKIDRVAEVARLEQPGGEPQTLVLGWSDTDVCYAIGPVGTKPTTCVPRASIAPLLGSSGFWVADPDAGVVAVWASRTDAATAGSSELGAATSAVELRPIPTESGLPGAVGLVAIPRVGNRLVSPSSVSVDVGGERLPSYLGARTQTDGATK